MTGFWIQQLAKKGMVKRNGGSSHNCFQFGMTSVRTADRSVPLSPTTTTPHTALCSLLYTNLLSTDISTLAYVWS